MFYFILSFPVCFFFFSDKNKNKRLTDWIELNVVIFYCYYFCFNFNKCFVFFSHSSNIYNIISIITFTQAKHSTFFFCCYQPTNLLYVYNRISQKEKWMRVILIVKQETRKREINKCCCFCWNSFSFLFFQIFIKIIFFSL